MHVHVNRKVKLFHYVMMVERVRPGKLRLAVNGC